MQDNRKLLGVRVSPELHKVIKQAALDNDVTIQDYVVGLIMADVQIGIIERACNSEILNFS